MNDQPLINTQSHSSVFNSKEILPNGYQALIIGCGALGSNVALSLARLGVNRFILVDPDVVSAHNLANQVGYCHMSVGSPKVTELARALRRLPTPERALSSLSIQHYRVHFSDFVQHHSLPGSLCPGPQQRGRSYDRKGLHAPTDCFVCVDSMRVREEIGNVVFVSDHDDRLQIMDRVINGKTPPNRTWSRPIDSDQGAFVPLFLEGRMRAEGGTAYAVNMGCAKSVVKYQQTMYPDSDVPVDAGHCGTVSVGPTASITANLMVWLWMQHRLQQHSLLPLYPPVLPVPSQEKENPPSCVSWSTSWVMTSEVWYT